MTGSATPGNGFRICEVAMRLSGIFSVKATWIRYYLGPTRTSWSAVCGGHIARIRFNCKATPGATQPYRAMQLTTTSFVRRLLRCITRITFESSVVQPGKGGRRCDELGAHALTGCYVYGPRQKLVRPRVRLQPPQLSSSRSSLSSRSLIYVYYRSHRTFVCSGCIDLYLSICETWQATPSPLSPHRGHNRAGPPGANEIYCPRYIPSEPTEGAFYLIHTGYSSVSVRSIVHAHGRVRSVSAPSPVLVPVPVRT